jgi:hypothetical protein
MHFLFFSPSLFLYPSLPGDDAICLLGDYPLPQCVALPLGGLFPGVRRNRGSRNGTSSSSSSTSTGSGSDDSGGNGGGGGGRAPPVFPLAFFPLTGGVFASFPFARYQGAGVGVQLVEDKKFGLVSAVCVFVLCIFMYLLLFCVFGRLEGRREGQAVWTSESRFLRVLFSYFTFGMGFQ